MDYTRLKLFLNSIKYLKTKQIYYRLYYFFKKIVFKNKTYKQITFNYNPIIWKDSVLNYTSFNKKEMTFNFLNILHTYNNKIDWNYQGHGKLWIYNLNYFDFINQEKISKEDSLFLIKDFISKKQLLLDANEPYPVSLRCLNWVKFLSKNKINNSLIDKIIYNDFIFLSKNLEYHLLGNHLLENAFSLLFGSYYFQNEKLYDISKELLKKELDEQILNDGSHFELSPMYHQTIFYRLLDSINLIRLNKSWKSNDLLIFLKQKASLMYSWLQNITYQNGDIPMVNDSTYNISPSSKKLFSYAEKLKIPNAMQFLSDSGYRKINTNKFELFLDIGEIGPDYQPGHSHCDTFSFELCVNKLPFIVDKGISTYEKNLKRHNQRSTESHNVVKINNKEQSEVWGGFRVGRRARIISLIEKDFYISAQHDGYKSEGIIHERNFRWKNDQILIEDSLGKSSKNQAKAFFHFHSSIDLPVIKKNKVVFNDVGVNISFLNSTKIKVKEYELSKGFNFTIPAFKLVVDFDSTLTTQIQL